MGLCLPMAQMPLKQGANAEILTPHKNFDFRAAFESSVASTVHDVQVRVMSVDQLISLKKLSNRPKDQFHIKCLEKIAIPDGL